MDILDLLTRSGTYILAVAVWLLTHFTRKIFELGWPSLKKQADANAPQLTYLTQMSRWWNEVILPILPVVYGALATISSSAVLFGDLDRTSKVMFGSGVGWFSGILYKSVLRMLEQKAGLKLEPISEVTK